MLIDSHAHLHDKAYDEDREELIKRLKESNTFVITIGTDEEESRKAVALAEAHENIFCTVGVHPNDNVEEVFDELEFEEFIKSKKVVAVGECGLEYYRIKGDVNFEEERERQINIFRKQLTFAERHNLPVMLHGRPSVGSDDVYEDMINILSEYKVVGNVHFFVGSKNIAERFVKMGYTFSFGGVTTITNDYDEMIRSVPIENILLETDSPYVAPREWRGRRNSPEYLPAILKRIAEIKGVSEEEMATATVANTKRIFNLSI